MKETVPVEVEVSVKRTLPMDRNILCIKVLRTKKGLKVRLKSSCLEAYFSQLDEGKVNTRPWGNFLCYKGDDLTLPPNLRDALSEDHWRHSIAASFNGTLPRYNLSILRAVGLSKGIEILWPGLYPETIVNGWLSLLQTAAMHIYVLYLKPKGHTISISIKEVVDENIRGT